MKNVECKTKRNVHRVCFDFNEAEEAIDFFESIQALDDSLTDCQLVWKDSLHDKERRVHNFLVRRKGDRGNGRPVEHTTISETRTVIHK